MSVSLYYTASRSQPLRPAEKSKIEELIRHYSVDVQDSLNEYLQDGSGYNWSGFAVYDPPSPGAIFEGSTKLPDNTEDATWTGLQYWLLLLNEIRRLLSDAEWRVHVDDHDIAWDEQEQSFDPTS